MKKTLSLAILLAFGSAGSLLAHHSLANYDTTKAVRVKGTIVQVNLINPHSIIYLEEKLDSGIKRWAIEGPSIMQLNRSGFSKDTLKYGDVIEVCGYAPKEPIVWQVAGADTSVASFSGRLLNAELMVTPDGKQRSWGDYGVHKCFEAGFTDQHSK